MQIAELKNGSSKVSITAKVVEKGKTREVNTRFGQNQVAEATIEDASGSIVLVLWGDEIMKINDGDSIKIENGYVKEWNGTLQLSVGKFGKLTVL
ncbi:MAG: DNA-binding protein [Candidatus Aenigmarchaeota archaeon]|nr:DNA-binding protein [Candidatus Aenigmarchaeota archaeon]